MHNTALVSTLLLPLLIASTTARVIPLLPPHPYILPRSDISIQPAQALLSSSSSLDNKCTFTLWHKQISSTTSQSTPSAEVKDRTNYIYLPILTDHTNSLTISITERKPLQEHNSYTHVSSTRAYSITGLLDDDALTISAREGDDALVFDMDDLRWVAGGIGEENVSEDEAWCQVGGWAESGSRGNRERKMECAFRCVKMEEEAGEREELR
ncbi:hypothetical protein DDE82_006327 [Stemphylium lycopersici]|nr:hypothetical protein TW65_00290 [Stemphylium lycopersici]RAR01713.1 hypothetical protein DDE82_006327 [Stemphylium lycopersici]